MAVNSIQSFIGSGQNIVPPLPLSALPLLILSDALPK